MRLILLCLLFSIISTGESQQISHRHLSDLNWMEIQKLVPSQIQTVFLPVGTLEAHGVINNGADIIAPEKFSEALAPQVNALIAPTITYGATRSLSRYPGSFGISDEVLRGLYYEVMRGLAEMGFKNIIVLNGHGPNRPILDAAAQKLFLESKVRILVVDWWSYASDIIKEVFGENGGHAGNNETAAIMAIDPSLVHKELYSPKLARPIDRSYSAYPDPATILLYEANQGLPDFDPAKAERYFKKVEEKLRSLITSTIESWNRSGL